MAATNPAFIPTRPEREICQVVEMSAQTTACVMSQVQDKAVVKTGN
jgi:hypothetical protein